MNTAPVTIWVSAGTYVSWLAALLAATLGLGAWMRERRSWAHAAFGVGMLALGLEALFVGLASVSYGLVDYVQWQRWRLVPLAIAPAAWLIFSLTYSRGTPEEFLRRWRWVAIGFFVLPTASLLFGWDQALHLVGTELDPSSVFLALGLPSYLLHLALICGGVLALMNLERTFRAAVGTMRWRIKLVVVGVVVLLVTRIYSSSQGLSYQAVDLRFEIVNSCALLLASLLVGLSFARTHVFGVDVYPSHAVLRSSLTVFLVGVYLVVVGVLAKVVGFFGGTGAFPFQAFMVMVLLAILALLLMSDRLRMLTRQFVSRHLRRPSYDYREIWQTFTQKISPQVTTDGFGLAAAQWLSESFEVLSASVLVADQAHRRLLCAASTVTREDVPREVTLSSAEYESLSSWSLEESGLRDLEAVRDSWAEGIRQVAPVEFKDKGGRR